MPEETDEIFVEDVSEAPEVDESADEITENDPADAPEEEPDEEVEGDPDTDDDESDDLDLARAKAKIAKVNSEAKGLRARNRELIAENERLRATANGEARRRIAREAGLPSDFADRLVGENEDDWVSDAKSLAATLKVANKPARTTNSAASRAEKGAAQLSPEDEFFDGTPL